VLRVGGVNFRPEEFLKDSALVPCQIFSRGERKAEGRAWATSGFNVVVSEASGENFTAQLRDSVGFLQKHREELERLRAHAGVEDLSLDFGVREAGGFYQSFFVPSNLVALAGSLGLGLELTVYREANG